MSFMTESVSRIGGRVLNEDSYGFLEMNHAAWLGGCRWPGRAPRGRSASKMAVEAALASFRATPELCERTAALQRHLEAAQQAVLQAQQSQPNLSTMRTTIVVLLTDSARVLWAHVGDSRLYCLENGHIVFCTKDHSVVQAMVNAGESRQAGYGIMKTETACSAVWETAKPISAPPFFPNRAPCIAVRRSCSAPTVSGRTSPSQRWRLISRRRTELENGLD